MISVDAQPIDGNLAIDAQNQYGNHADYLDVNAIIQHGRISVDAYEKPAGLQCYIPLFNTISPWWGELALDAGSHVRASVATRINPTTGLIESLANNIPRFEKYTLAALLDEPTGTNLIQYSHELDDGWWTRTRLTSITVNGMLAPDGNIVADGLVADGGNVAHYINTPAIAGITQNDKVVQTVFVKPGNEDWILIQVAFRTALNAFIGLGSYYFDIANGVIGATREDANVTIHSYMIQPAANDFYKVGLIVSINDATVDIVRVDLFSAHVNANAVFTGDTTTVNTWVWGADLKKQAYFDSYVPTSGATATRATESGYPLYDLPLGLFNAEGTASVWVRLGGSSVDFGVNEFGFVTSQDAYKSIIYSTGFGAIKTRDGLNVGVINLAYSANTWYKLVAKWSSTTLKMQVGYDSGAGIVWGGEVAFDGSYTLGTALRLAYGLYGPIWFHKLMIFDRTATDIEINAHHGSP